MADVINLFRKKKDVYTRLSYKNNANNYEKTGGKKKKQSYDDFNLPQQHFVEWPRYKERDARSVLAWRAASLLSVRLLFVLKPHMRDDG